MNVYLCMFFMFEVFNLIFLWEFRKIKYFGYIRLFKRKMFFIFLRFLFEDCFFGWSCFRLLEESFGLVRESIWGCIKFDELY